MSETPKTVFVTKYALTDGIVEAEVNSYDDDGWARVRRYGLTPPRYFSQTRDEAVKQAETMKAKKLASLRKQIAKLEAMTFA